MARARQEIRERIDARVNGVPEVEEDALQTLITDEVLSYSRDQYLTFSEKEELIVGIYNSMRRLGILQPLLEDESVSEIMINGPDCIFVERQGLMEKWEQRFDSTETLENIIQNIVSRVNRTVNESSPIVDARLADGSRIAVVLPPVSIQGPVMAIRKFPESPLTVADLLTLGSITPEAVRLLSELVRCRYNLFISGGTSSGKTTFLNILSRFIPDGERIVTIEDSAELQIPGRENLIRLEARTGPNVRTRIGIRELIRTALRLRPDRIIVGEVRGREALDMLQAMNTGHEGSLSTGHANTARDALSRLEVMAVEAGELPVPAIRQQIAGTLEVVVQLTRLGSGARRVVEIAEVLPLENGEYRLHPLFAYDHRQDRLLCVGPLQDRRKLVYAGGELP